MSTCDEKPFCISGHLIFGLPDNEEHNGTNDEKYNNDWHEENQSSPESNVFWNVDERRILFVRLWFIVYEARYQKVIMISLTNIIVSVFSKNEESELGTILGKKGQEEESSGRGLEWIISVQVELIVEKWCKNGIETSTERSRLGLVWTFKSFYTLF